MDIISESIYNNGNCHVASEHTRNFSCTILITLGINQNLIVLLNIEGFFSSLIDIFENMVSSGMAPQKIWNCLKFVRT
ncbi:hypothetical protein C6Y11_07050 [Lactiplantibacillus pentosus]|nr:hypothetical protein [Lactiplantibacillus pentosus]PRO80037.1 hypothetical protein C6Y11_07050 [Lactiplantibacillus pentosus]PRO82802.1 hypothetical protein C6Y09_02625 [Lactiplantibacillus pentosus]PRO92705.1 hypothetical protein C6Y12_04175 [Lactiplantibacillus pentosus]